MNDISLLISDININDWFDIFISTFFFFILFKIVLKEKYYFFIIGIVIFFVPLFIGWLLGFPISKRLFLISIYILILLFATLFAQEIKLFFDTVIGNFFEKKLIQKNLLTEIYLAVKYASENKIGMLIVIENNFNLRDFIEAGEKLFAPIKASLLLSIFFPNSPLHDGAVIISENKIASAATFLPLTNKKLPVWMGSRHRAAIGITEQTDAIAILVSEETGKVKLIKNAKIQTIKPDEIMKL